MKFIFNEKFYEEYDTDPAASTGRLEPTIKLVSKDPFYEFVPPIPALEIDILWAHTQTHFDRIKRSMQYEMAMLAAGGAIQTAELAYDGMPAFGFIRPPGHHASAGDCWGFCFFNNMAISTLKLKHEKKIDSAFILDFDLHFGDGTRNILGSDNKITYFHPDSKSESDYLSSIEQKLNGLSTGQIDIIGVSAGFDNAVGDWGGVLTKRGYAQIGKMVREQSIRLCKGRRFAILEGGYNYSLMAYNLDAFCKEFGVS